MKAAGLAMIANGASALNALPAMQTGGVANCRRVK
jgi:hypothetical protein